MTLVGLNMVMVKEIPLQNCAMIRNDLDGNCPTEITFFNELKLLQQRY